MKDEARWPTVLLQSPARQLIWSMCSILGVYGKGVPGSACRLLERYLSRHILHFLEENRGKFLHILRHEKISRAPYQNCNVNLMVVNMSVC